LLFCKQSAVSVDAHYREIRIEINCFLKFLWKKWLFAQNTNETG